jgi:hypothetical protein
MRTGPVRDAYQMKQHVYSDVIVAVVTSAKQADL